jgi:hypothetical protein
LVNKDEKIRPICKLCGMLSEKRKTMKQTFTILFFIILTLSCYGQSIFFDNLKNSTWTSNELYTDKKIESAKEISLTKHSDKDTLNADANLWVFNDALDIRLYNKKSRCVSDISRHKYFADKDKGLLKIILTDKLTLTYKIGIVSTGNHILLIRQK